MNIAGANCPIRFGWVLTQNIEESGGFSASLKMKYAAVKDIAKLIDVLSYKLEHSESSSQTGINGSGSGLIESKSQGNIKLELTKVGSGDANGAAVFNTTRVVYPDGLIVELQDVTSYAPDQEPKSKYFINYTTVSEREYKEAMQSLGMNKANFN